jgi:hypothetical protein
LGDGHEQGEDLLPGLSGSGGVRQRAQPLAVLAAIGLAFVAVAGEVRAENPEISMKRSTPRQSFTNEEIIDGFYKIAFGAELQLDQPVERIRKFDGPVRVFVINQGGRDRLKRIAAVVGDIRARVNHLGAILENGITLHARRSPRSRTCGRKVAASWMLLDNSEPYWLAASRAAWQLNHIDNSGDQENAGCEHQDFSNVEAGEEKHSAHGYPQSSTRHRQDCAIGTAAKM